MSNDRRVFEAGSTSRSKKQLLIEFRQEDVNDWRKVAEIQKLEGRLSVLEEEAKLLKGALMESVEERTKLITEIHHHFDSIQHFLLQREQESHSHEKDKRAGLLEILCQESNPSVVNKGLTTKALC